MTEQLNMQIFAEPDPPQRRTQAGTLMAGFKKAIAWYVGEHGLQVTATSAYPPSSTSRTRVVRTYP